MFKKNAKGGYIPPEPPMFKYENVQTEVEPPMNPNAEEDFAKAIREAKEMPIFPLTEQKAKVRLKWSMSSCVDDFINILLLNGYKVTAYLNGYSNEFTLLDKEQYVTVEFEEVVDPIIAEIKAEAEALQARLRK